MSDDINLGQLLNKAETAHLEHKSLQASSASIAHVVGAFLNTGGGTILIEVGAVEAEARSKIDVITKELRETIAPPALWSLVLEESDQGFWGILDVPAGRDRPYTVGGTIFVRKGAQTVPAAHDDLRELVHSSFSGSERWERKLIPGSDLSWLDEKLVQNTAVEAKSHRNFQFANINELDSVLSDLGMWREHAVTQGAEVAFGRRPAIQFPQIRVRVTVYARDKGGDFLDSKHFDSAGLTMLEQVFAMIQQHTPLESSFPAGLRRRDRPSYPEAAVREGLVNAFVHRDYANFSGGIAVDLYPERLVIWNSGALPEGMKLGDLKREHPSMPRNPDIAQVFFFHGLMERVGRGTQKILYECKEFGMPAPEWKSEESGVTLTFRTRSALRQGTYNLRERKVLDDLDPGDVIRATEYMERLAVSERTARRDLGHLVDEGWLSREGEGPATVYRRTRQPWDSAKSGQEPAK